MADEATEAPEAPPREPVMSSLNVDPRYKGYNWLLNYRLTYDISMEIKIEVISKFYFSALGKDGWIHFSFGRQRSPGRFCIMCCCAYHHFFWSQPYFRGSFPRQLKNKKRRRQEDVRLGNIQRATRRITFIFFQIYHYYAKIIAWKFSLYSQRLH